MRYLLLAVLALLILSGCADPNAQFASNEYNSCMQLCYGTDPMCQPASPSYNHDGDSTVLPVSILNQDYSTWVFCTALLEDCKESCGFDHKD